MKPILNSILRIAANDSYEILFTLDQAIAEDEVEYIVARIGSRYELLHFYKEELPIVSSVDISYAANLDISLLPVNSSTSLTIAVAPPELEFASSTEEWIAEYGFRDGKMLVEDNSTFTPYTQSDGRFVPLISLYL